MIVLRKTSWIRILFKFRGTAAARIWPRVALTTLIAAAVTYVHSIGGYFSADLTLTPFNLIGLALGIFLGFRNNTSYDRFWEGRKLWGRLVNTSRSLARQTLVLIGPQPQDGEPTGVDGDVAAQRQMQEEIVHETVAYVHALRLHLRGETDRACLEPLIGSAAVDSLETEHNPPVAILLSLGERFQEAWRRRWVHPLHLSVLEASLTELTNIQGGCERIKSTPIPFSYTALIHRIVALYCFALPFGLVDTTEWLTPVVVAIISFAFFGLDAVGDEIENPFDKDDNDLPLSALSTMIEVNLRQSLGETELPALLKPVNERLH